MSPHPPAYHLVNFPTAPDSPPCIDSPEASRDHDATPHIRETHPKQAEKLLYYMKIARALIITNCIWIILNMVIMLSLIFFLPCVPDAKRCKPICGNNLWGFAGRDEVWSLFDMWEVLRSLCSLDVKMEKSRGERVTSSSMVVDTFPLKNVYWLRQAGKDLRGPYRIFDSTLIHLGLLFPYPRWYVYAIYSLLCPALLAW